MAKKKDPADEENPQEPVFHESENFISAYFGELPEDVAKSIPRQSDKKLLDSLVAQLTDPRLRETKDEVLRLLKENNAQDLLVDVTRNEQDVERQRVLIAACWETGLDFSKHLLFFVELAVNGNYDHCLEAMTVITENMAGPFDAQEVEKAMRLLDPVSGKADGRAPLFSAISGHIRQGS
jgi:hypothetical protein